MILRLAAGLLALFTVMLPALACTAHTLAVCGTVEYLDTRAQRSDLTGSILTLATRNTNRDARHLTITLMDEDGDCNDAAPWCSETDDDVLGTTTTTSTGNYCFYNIAHDEDIYIKTYFEGQHFRLFGADGSPPVVGSLPTEFDFGLGRSGIYYKNWNVTCSNASYGTCTPTVASTHFPSNEAYANVFASTVDVAKAVPSTALYRNGSTDKIKVFYPTDPWGDCLDEEGEPQSEAHRDWFCVSTHLGNHTLAHEAGHVIWMRALDIDNGDAAPGCSGHSWYSWLPEKCAVQEGWADFVAAASYFCKAAGQPAGCSGPAYFPYAYSNFQNVEGTIAMGNSIPQECTHQSSSPQNREGNVARFFWDVYDATGVSDVYGGYNDNTSLSMNTMVDVWDRFPDGTGDHESREPGLPGRNAYDYVAHELSAQSELYSNCLTWQDH